MGMKLTTARWGILILSVVAAALAVRLSFFEREQQRVAIPPAGGEQQIERHLKLSLDNKLEVSPAEQPLRENSAATNNLTDRPSDESAKHDRKDPELDHLVQSDIPFGVTLDEKNHPVLNYHLSEKSKIAKEAEFKARADLREEKNF